MEIALVPEPGREAAALLPLPVLLLAELVLLVLLAALPLLETLTTVGGAGRKAPISTSSAVSLVCVVPLEDELPDVVVVLEPGDTEVTGA